MRKLVGEGVVVEVEERRPVALYSACGRTYLVDDEGVPFKVGVLEECPGCPWIEGRKAEVRDAVLLLKGLARHPALHSLKPVQVKVKGEKMEVSFDGGPQVYFSHPFRPCELKRLALLIKEIRTLSVVGMIDLTFEDRAIVTLNEEGIYDLKDRKKGG